MMGIKVLRDGNLTQRDKKIQIVIGTIQLPEKNPGSFIPDRKIDKLSLKSNN